MFETQLTIGAGRGRFATAARHLPRCFIGLMFVLIGWTKFPDDPSGEWVRLFEQIGLGQWFRYLTGSIQIAGGMLFMVPRTSTPGAVLLVGTMLGAAAVDLVIVRTPLVIVPLMLTFVIVAAWAAD